MHDCASNELPLIKAISHLRLLINKSNINFCFIKLSIVITQAKRNKVSYTV